MHENTFNKIQTSLDNLTKKPYFYFDFEITFQFLENTLKN